MFSLYDEEFAASVGLQPTLWPTMLLTVGVSSLRTAKSCLLSQSLSRTSTIKANRLQTLPNAPLTLISLLQVLTNNNYRFKRIGLEAGPLSQWLFSALAEAGLPVICVETRHMRVVLKAQINKTDRNDARGIAQMMRVGGLGRDGEVRGAHQGACRGPS